MVRKYKRTLTNCRNGKNYRPYMSYSKEKLEQAVQAVKQKRLTILQAAEQYSVPKSTIGRRVLDQNINYKQPGRPTLFSEDEEQIIIHHLNMVASWGFPFDSLDLRLLMKTYLDKKGVQEGRLRDNLPGKDWVAGFLNRHKDQVSNRLSANISSKRAALSHYTIDRFFGNAEQVLKTADSSLLINYDETNLTDNPGAKKYIVKRGSKYPERVINSTKTVISLMYAGTADGQLLPIYVVYKAEHLWDSWTTGGPSGTRYNRSRSGWFDSVCFEDWFFSIVVPFCKSKEGHKILVGDNLSSHFSQKVLNACEDLNIKFICLPSNATHVLQPLDVAFYAPLKKYWRSILTNWKKTAGRRSTTLTKDAFPKLLTELQQALDENGKGSQNIISGFNKTGLYPLNPNRPKERLPQKETGDNASLVSDSVISLLSEMRGNTPDLASTSKPARRKRISVEPGKSIGAEDIASPSTLKQTKGKRAKKRRVIDDSSSSEAEENNDPNTLDGDTDSLEEGIERYPIELEDDGFEAEEREVGESQFDSDSSDDLPLAQLDMNRLPEEIPAVGQWVVVEYQTKKKTRHYVGQIEAVEEGEEGQTFLVDFLKKSSKTDNFKKPPSKDTDVISLDMIVKKLQEPKVDGSDSRRCYVFRENLSRFTFI